MFTILRYDGKWNGMAAAAAEKTSSTSAWAAAFF